MCALLYYMSSVEMKYLCNRKLSPEFPIKIFHILPWIGSPEVVMNDSLFVSRSWKGYSS